MPEKPYIGPMAPYDACPILDDLTVTGAASALDKQEGGDHYKTMKIQPVEFITENGMDFLQGNVVKYIARHKAKNGAADVRKALHYCQLILELQYGEKP